MYFLKEVCDESGLKQKGCDRSSWSSDCDEVEPALLRGHIYWNCWDDGVVDEPSGDSSRRVS